MARDLFLEKGYVQIGMDHFALPTDEMAKALESKELQRNFQGYSLQRSKDLIGLGVSSTGYVEGLYVQNIKEVDSYERLLKEDQWAIYKGKILSEEDRRRHWVIQRLMCDFSLLYDDYRLEFGRDFKKDFFFELESLQKEPYNELIKTQPETLIATGLGRIFIRVAVSLFDSYLHKSSQNRFSMSI
jgi:oxygen-independent coproporphyrinogen-3 oxidase